MNPEIAARLDELAARLEEFTDRLEAAAARSVAEDDELKVA